MPQSSQGVRLQPITGRNAGPVQANAQIVDEKGKMRAQEPVEDEVTSLHVCACTRCVFVFTMMSSILCIWN
jgi:hypothetical protein